MHAARRDARPGHDREPPSSQTADAPLRGARRYGLAHAGDRFDVLSEQERRRAESVALLDEEVALAGVDAAHDVVLLPLLRDEADVDRERHERTAVLVDGGGRVGDP